MPKSIIIYQVENILTWKIKKHVWQVRVPSWSQLSICLMHYHCTVLCRRHIAVFWPTYCYMPFTLLWGQGQRSTSRSKVKVKGRHQGQRSRSNVWRVAVDIRGSACRVHQSAITVKFGAKGGHYRSEGFVCLSVISRACADNRADAVDRLLIKVKFALL